MKSSCIVQHFKSIGTPGALLLPPSLREVSSGVSRKPDDGRRVPQSLCDSSLREGAMDLSAHLFTNSILKKSQKGL